MMRWSLVAWLVAALTVASAPPLAVTFSNELGVPFTLYRDGHRMHKHEAGDALRALTYDSGDGDKWTALDAHGHELFHYVVRAQDGVVQHIKLRNGVVRRTIRSIIESEDHRLHRVDGAGHEDVGCVDPVLGGDTVLLRALGVDGDPPLSRDGDGRIVAMHGAAGPDAVWTIDADKRGPLYPGNAVHLRHTATGLYIDAPPPVDDKHAALHARWADRGAWQTFTLFKGPEEDKSPLSAVCYGDAVFLLAHTRNFVDVNDGRAMARWRHRGEWQKLALERFVQPPADAPDL